MPPIKLLNAAVPHAAMDLSTPFASFNWNLSSKLLSNLFYGERKESQKLRDSDEMRRFTVRGILARAPSTECWTTDQWLL